MGICLVPRKGNNFKAFLQIQANPGATVTATLGGKSFSAVANANTGIATITVKKKGTYIISSNCSATDVYAYNNGTVTASKSNQTYTGTYVKLNKGYTTFAVSNAYGNNSLVAYWNGSKPSTYCTNYYVEEVTSSGYAGKYTGTGTSQVISSSSTLNGYREAVSSGTTKTYRLSSFITINGKNYHGAYKTAKGTAKTYSASATNVTTTKTLTVPSGCRSITAFVVGGGGKGGNGNESWNRAFSKVDNQKLSYSGGGGGGGGYVASKTIACIPGQTISCTIGASASNSSVTVNGTTLTVSKGSNGSNGTFYANVDVSGTTYYKVSDGGAGGAGNGAGGHGAGRVNNTYNKSYLSSSAGGSGSNGYGGGGGGGGSRVEYIPASQESDYWKLYAAALGGPGGSPGGGAGGASEFSTASGKYPVAGTANTGGGGGGGSYYGYSLDRRNTLVVTSGAAGGSGFIKVTYNF